MPGQAVWRETGKIDVVDALRRKHKRRKDEEKGNINGYDPEKAACVENLEVVRGGAGVEKNSPDEETGQNEEEINSSPGKPERNHSGRQQPCSARLHCQPA